MILLDRPGERPADQHVIAVFGVGLVGSALVAALGERGVRPAAHHPTSWANPDRLAEEVCGVEEALAGAGAGCLHVVWSAGRAGFGTAATEADAELAPFGTVLAMAARLAERCGEARVVFHMLSSAGGLFEGQRHVDRDSRPAPRRPYGELKLRQERLLAGAPDRLGKRVYRLTSVYGPARGQRRRGLIPTLVLDGLRQRVSSIVGRPTTLRDFTWAPDVGRFLAAEVLGAGGGEGVITHTLAAGVPTSILEARRIVERVLRRPLYLSYSSAPENCEDITFSPKLRPPRWSASDLMTNVKSVYYEELANSTPLAPGGTGVGGEGETPVSSGVNPPHLSPYPSMSEGFYPLGTRPRLFVRPAGNAPRGVP
jgi:UDP-glucose 4-epimerase